MSFVLEQIALGSREMSPSNRIFLQTLEKSALSYWIRSSEDPDPQPFHLLRLPTDFLEVTEPVYSLSLWGVEGGSGQAPRAQGAPCVLTGTLLALSPRDPAQEKPVIPEREGGLIQLTSGGKMSLETSLTLRSFLRVFSQNCSSSLRGNL